MRDDDPAPADPYAWIGPPPAPEPGPPQRPGPSLALLILSGVGIVLAITALVLLLVLGGGGGGGGTDASAPARDSRSTSSTTTPAPTRTTTPATSTIEWPAPATGRASGEFHEWVNSVCDRSTLDSDVTPRYDGEQGPMTCATPGGDKIWIGTFTFEGKMRNELPTRSELYGAYTFYRGTDGHVTAFTAGDAASLRPLERYGFVIMPGHP